MCVSFGYLWSKARMQQGLGLSGRLSVCQAASAGTPSQSSRMSGAEINKPICLTLWWIKCNSEKQKIEFLKCLPKEKSCNFVFKILIRKRGLEWKWRKQECSLKLYIKNAAANTELYKAHTCAMIYVVPCSLPFGIPSGLRMRGLAADYLGSKKNQPFVLYVSSSSFKTTVSAAGPILPLCI